MTATAAPKPRKELLIWWTSNAEMAIVGEAAPKQLPLYVQTQWSLRFGRSGRGRLWVDEKFGEREISEWPDTMIANMLKDGTSAGIVFANSDLGAFKGVPGIITDFKLRIVT